MNTLVLQFWGKEMKASKGKKRKEMYYSKVSGDNYKLNIKDVYMKFKNYF